MRFNTFVALALVSGIHLSCDSNSSSKNTPTPTAEPDASASGSPLPAPAPTPTPDDGQAPGENPAANPAGLVGGFRTNQGALFRNLGDGIARKGQGFAASTDELAQAIASYCTNPVNADKTAVRSAWKKSMLLWEEFEVFQIGPIAADEKALKTAIYSWPQLPHGCRIDEEVLNASKNPDYTLPINTNRKGLSAIEYLLYEDKLVSACSPANAVYKEWDALPIEARVQARCAYLKPLAAELQGLGSKLNQVWGTEGNNYLTSVIGNAAAEKAALQSIYENLFYLDIEVKNYKLATPAGHDKKFCPNSPAPCPGKDEFPMSQISREAIQANISAFTDLIYGFEDANQQRPGGFAALVREVGDNAVATRSETLTRELVNYFATQDESLAALIEQQKQEDCEQSQISVLCQLRKSIKQISQDLKNEYSRLLALKVPAGPQGDND